MTFGNVFLICFVASALALTFYFIVRNRCVGDKLGYFIHKQKIYASDVFERSVILNKNGKDVFKTMKIISDELKFARENFKLLHDIETIEIEPEKENDFLIQDNFIEYPAYFSIENNNPISRNIIICVNYYYKGFILTGIIEKLKENGFNEI